MVQHEDKFFQKVADSFAGFAPEAPADVYAVVRKRYGIAAFLTWNAMRLNVYYALILCSAGVGAFYLTGEECAQTAHEAHPLLLEEAILLKAQQSIVETVAYEPEVQSAEPCAPKTAAHHVAKAKSTVTASAVTTSEVETEVSVSTETDSEAIAAPVRVKKDRKSLKVNEVKEVVAPKN